MRITGLQISAFGRFRDVTFRDLDHPVVCISGPNEIGKTTLFDFVSSMLYGLSPADPSTNPYAPREGRHLQGRPHGSTARPAWPEAHA